MSIQYWIVKAADNNLYTIGLNKDPDKNVYLEAVLAPIDILTGLPEEGVWCQIESIEKPDDPGFFDRVATVNETLKTSILAQRETDRIQSELDEETKKTILLDIKTRVKNLKKQDLSTAENIKDAIMDLQQFIIQIEERLLNTVDDGKKDK